MTLEELLDEFEFLEDWEERCEYLIELGFELPKLSAEAKVEDNRVRGCQSNVWMVIALSDTEPSVVAITAESDAMLVNGLIAVLLAIFDGKRPDAVLSTDVGAILAKLGLDRHLSTARRNGLYGMVKKIHEFAEQKNKGTAPAEY